MSNIYLFKYNNFFNRLVKREETIGGYGNPLFVLENANFNPNDGVSALHIINYVTLSDTPDYAVITEEGGTISSRWFVMEVQRTRGLQYRMHLLRDVMAEYREEIMNSTAFIEKGFVTQDNPLIFNNENMGFNQIKSGEYLLRNRLNTPWLVLYLSRYKSEKNNGVPVYNTFQGSFQDDPGTSAPDYVLESLSDYKYNYYTENEYIYADPDDFIYVNTYRIRTNEGTYAKFQTNSKIDSFALTGINEYGDIPSGLTSNNYPLYVGSVDSFGEPNGTLNSIPSYGDFAGMYQTGYETRGGLLVNSYTGYGVLGERGELGVLQLTRENGKIIKVGSNFYRIEINTEIINYPPGFPDGGAEWGNNPLQKNIISPSSILGQEMVGSVFYNNENLFQTNNIIADSLYILSKPLQKYKLKFTEISDNNLSYEFTYTKAITKSCSYEIIAAPLFDVQFVNVPGIQGGVIEHVGNIAMQWFQNIVNTYNAEGAAYDLQLLPYCPIDNNDLSNYEVEFCYKTGDTDSRYAVAIKLPVASFSDRIQLNTIPVRDNLKLSNELDLYRLVSPNGVGEYEWSVAKNGGRTITFEIDCTLIPLNPYIKINPYFSNLYGNDYNDYRGLICGGDFSMPILNNAWETFQLSNKYYQDIFNRDIEHQEYNNKYAKIQDITNAVFGTLQGGMQGAQAGAAGGPVGMVIGGALGTVTSAVGGTMDSIINENLRREGIQYQKDKFGYELGTIKARSESLTRSSAYNINNKYFPYVEYYTCTSVEVEAFKNKIKYNGMTVEVIGKIRDYLDPSSEWTYIQGEIIFLDIPEDYQVVNEINRNLRGGVRIVYPE